MLPDTDLYQRIARLTPAASWTALTPSPQHLAVGDAGGNRDVERAPVWQGDARLGAVHRVEEIDFKAILGIGPAHRESSTTTSALARASTLAEQIAEQVAKGADILEARRRAIARPVLASGIFAVVVLLLPRRGALAAVVPAALLGIAKDV